MAHGKHPLDVFRSSGKGFDSASRRRSVAGRVISSSHRSQEAGEAEAPADEKAGDDTPAPAAGRPKVRVRMPRREVPVPEAGPTKKARQRRSKEAEAAGQGAPSKAAERPPAKRKPAKAQPEAKEQASEADSRSADDQPTDAKPARARVNRAAAPKPKVEKPIAQPGQPRVGGGKRLGAPLLRPGEGFSAKGLSQVLFGVSLVAMATLAVIIVVNSDLAGWGGDAPEGKIPSLSAASVLDPGPGGQPIAPPVGMPEATFTIRVGTYAGSTRGQELAWAAYDGLEALGIPVHEPLGIPVAGGKPGEVSECQLLVGLGETREELEGLLAEVKQIDWKTGEKKPFRTASIVTHPDSGR